MTVFRWRMGVRRVGVLVVVATLVVGCISSEFKSGAPSHDSTGRDAGSESGSGGNDGAGGGAAGGASGASGAGSGTGGVQGASGNGAGTGSAPGTGGGAGSEGDAGDAGVPCDETKEPSVETCLLDERYSVFVAADAQTAGDGSKAHPFRSIGAALTAAQRAHVGRVILCTGTYDENVVMRKVNSAVSLYGSFSCPPSSSAWAYTPTRRSRIRSTTGTTLLVDGAAAKVVISDIDVVSELMAGASSIGAVVKGSADVTFRRALVQSSGGAGGEPGADGIAGADGDTPDDAIVAQPYTCGTGPDTVRTTGGSWAAASACGSKGGEGGPGFRGAAGGEGGGGTPTVNTDPVHPYNFGYSILGDPSLRKGGVGSNGVAGRVGVAGPPLGVFTVDGYAPADGKPGSDGFVGQGGGGGGGSPSPSPNCAGPAGGAGGMGGCGGKPGAGGKGGGASVALFVWDSKVALEDVTLQAGYGGSGGRGGEGGLGGVGGSGEPGGMGADDMNTGGSGGDGGNGGPGGGGSGGSGGPSYGIVFHGQKPVESGTTKVAASDGGKGGVGGGARTTGAAKAPDGATGPAAPRFEVNP